MSDRAGPPSPRTEPWRMPTPSLPEQPGRTPIPARDAAFEAWAGQLTTNRRSLSRKLSFRLWTSAMMFKHWTEAHWRFVALMTFVLLDLVVWSIIR